MKRVVSTFAALVLLLAIVAPTIAAPPTRIVRYTGDGNYLTEVCGVTNGAETQDAYLRWELSGISNAAPKSLRGRPGYAQLFGRPMIQTDPGTFTLLTQYYTPEQIEAMDVFATYSGRFSRNATLVIAEGCDHDALN